MIEYEQRGEVAWITIDRPEKLNAFTLAGWRDFREALDRAERDGRAAVVIGAGEAFSAGDDVGLLDIETMAAVEELADVLYDVFFGIETLSIPVVSAVNGLAYGGGFEIVAASDIAVATTDAEFAIPEARLGLYPIYSMERVAALGGRKPVFELAMSNEPVDAERAEQWGLVNRVVKPDALEPTIEEFLENALTAPPQSISMIKRRGNAWNGDANERELIKNTMARLYLAGTPQEGAQAFLEGRDSAFPK